MKETVKTSRTAGYLEKMFRTINADLFNGEIEEPIITIQSTPRAYGHVTVYKVWSKKEEQRHELNIGAGTLARPIENVVATMIHEMCHLWNLKFNIQDTSRGGSYHNKKFKDLAEAHMLHIEHDEKYGWKLTSPTEELLDYIISKGWTEIEMNRFEGMSYTGTGTPKGKDPDTETGTPTPTKKTSWKHKCPKCGLIARTTKVAKLKCFDCDEEMTIED